MAQDIIYLFNVILQVDFSLQIYWKILKLKISGKG